MQVKASAFIEESLAFDLVNGRNPHLPRADAIDPMLIESHWDSFKLEECCSSRLSDDIINGVRVKARDKRKEI